jgi:hypothetical protein
MPNNSSEKPTRYKLKPKKQRLNAEQFAGALALLYPLSFGGKEDCKYKLPREHARDMCDWGRLSESFLLEVSDYLLDWGYEMLQSGENLVIQKSSIITNMRIPPKHLRRLAVDGALRGEEELQLDDDDDSSISNEG